MNHRKTLGFESDVAESAALTIADERATERIYEACDWEHIKREEELEVIRERNRKAKRRTRAVNRVREQLGDVYADVLKAYLDHKSWKDIGIPKRTFGDRLKKVKIFFGVLE